ncbi:AraC family transcriptional regulator [Clostridium pasteurianum]|uniref:Response regulator containing CheY-like receiver domain and AraC-type DNA-binding domain n=1 Tax=Clostridium pasteurianum BC1 TaxID=86416 RepID=R4K9Z9_CLOPA|nr:AraC family transcriptional regulator [Clostridium pasteurianum]AGK99403.1 response regulator containing CheY-like receiver domain and AraC-type DNA-binding domain [Clostridium pasteurianum BC1]
MNSEFLEINENVYISRSKDQSPFTMHHVHYHDCYEIIFFLSGNVSYFIKDKIYPIQKYDLIFISPFDLHRVTNTGGKYYERIVINFKEKFFNKAYIKNSILKFFNSNINKIPITNNDVRNIFNSLCYEKKINDVFSDIRINLLVEELLIILNREVRHNTFRQDNNIKDEKVLSIISYINDNYMNDITLSLLSDKFYISQSHLVHLFKNIAGFTIMDYLNKKRISAAQQMLSNNNYNIRSVGELVGYNNLTSFSRTFKAISGVSPMQYKKQHKIE